MARLRILAGLAAAALIGGGLLWVARRAPVPEGLVPANGQIEARRIDIAVRLAGRVAEIAVEEGDLVAPGDLLGRIDTDTPRAQMARAEAAVAAARSAAAGHAAVLQAEARRDLVRRDLRAFSAPTAAARPRRRRC